MGDRIAPDGGRRFSYALLAFAVVASLVQVVSIQPALAAPSGSNGPAVVPGADSSALTSATKQWDTKNQHRIWWNASQNRWDAILPTASGWQIAKQAIPNSFGAAPTYGPTFPGFNSKDRPDVYWDESAGKLYVLFSGATTHSHVVTYNSAGDTYTVGASVPLTSMNSSASRAAIYKTSNGDLWASVMTKGKLLVSRSSDDGTSWSTPLNLNVTVDEGQTQMTSFTNGATYLALAAAENGDADLTDGRYSQYLFYKLDMANVANWSSGVTLATGSLTISALPAAGDTVTIDGRTYRFVDSMVGAVAYDVLIGGNPRANLAAAIEGTGTEGIEYGPGTLPNPSATISDPASPTMTVTSRESDPTIANAVVTTASLTQLGDGFAAATLTGGTSSWTKETVPLAQNSPMGTAVVHADDEISLVTHNNVIYIATETQRSGGGTKSLDPQVILYKRTGGLTGSWIQSNVKFDQQSSTGDRKRPVVAIYNSTVYVIAIDNP
ncbi:MAG: sialidase family protein, partial [Acidimicrobiia bacterium]